MNASMVYRFSWKAWAGFLLLFSLGSSRLLAHQAVYMSFCQYQGTKQWALDLSKLEPGASMYLIVEDSSDLDSWQELEGQRMRGLFDYAMPRFTLDYDSFDCLVRTLITDPDSGTENVRGTGEILGIPGSPVKKPAVARGGTDNLDIRYLTESELQGFYSWIKPGQFVVEIRLKAEAIQDKRLLLFDHEALTVPYCFGNSKGKGGPLAVHLFTMDGEGSVLPKNWNMETGTVLLSSEIMKQRRTFQDTLLSYWQGLETPMHVYGWDIGLSGGDKCAPCVAPPRDFSLLQELGMDKTPEHWYVNYIIFSPGSPRELHRQKFEAFQWIFEMHEPAKGFLNCEEAGTYKEMVKKRRELELLNLYELLGERAGIFVD